MARPVVLLADVCYNLGYVDNRRVSTFQTKALETLHCFLDISGDAHVNVTLFSVVTQCDSNALV